jgi:AAA+ ATPase superfamily predicted ATPase
MRFYDRQQELTQLAEIRERSFSKHSQMTIITGRRRIGKTKLIAKSCEGTPTVYLFIARSNEATICSQFSATVRQALNCYVPDGIKSFVQLFEQIMVVGKTQSFNLVIDEFQELYNINPSAMSGIQDVWDRYKDDTHVNLIASGSVYTLMHKIFMDYNEPLYGRCDTIIKLRPFATSVVKQILSDNNPSYTNDDLLALYAITGGIPKYIELLIDREAFTVDAMIDRFTEPNSIFLEEGTILLATELGKKYGNYFSILSAIASGRNTAPAIAQAVGDASIGGLLSRLEDDYELISKKRPILAKERSQNVRYEIRDNFLRFWFRYVARNQNLLQMGQNSHLNEIIKADYQTYSGLILEDWFRCKLAESGKYANIGAWWDNAKGAEQSEIDIVAIPIDKDAPIFVAEVKRQRKNYKPELLNAKVEHLRNKVLHNHPVTADVLTLGEM